MEKLMKDLDESVKLKQDEKIITNLNKIITRGNGIEITKADSFEILLKHKNNDILKFTTQTIAELAKNDKNRNCLTKESIISLLLPLLESSDSNITLQTCRALGNICFENDDARKIMDKKGLQSLITLIQNTIKSKSFDTKLITTTCGCLMNLIMCNDDLQRASLDYNVLEVVEFILKRNFIDFDANEDCTTHLLLILNMVTEYMNDEWLSESLCSIVVDILRVSMNPEISALCLEILRMQSENDDIKLCLAKKGTCELVYELVEKHGSHVDDEESRSVLKMACDLIVLILTGDESMDLLYDSANGKVYEQMVYWLNSEDVDLLSTGVLAIGNFARNDSHCIQMVDNGLAKKLLGILKYYSTDGDTKVQHALLSTLRNLSIPMENKSKLLDENLLDTLLSMMDIDQSPVEFKLLGTLRMVVDGQEKTAMDLITRKDFIEKLVHWCYNSEHLGVRGEAPRLLAWLIKNCHSAKPYSLVLSIPNTVKCLVEMTSSMHAVMQNEALLALNLLCASCLNNENDTHENIKSYEILPELLVNAETGKNIGNIFDKYHQKLERETTENILTLLEQLIRNEVVLNDLKSNNVHKTIVNLLSNTNLTLLSERINRLVDNMVKQK